MASERQIAANRLNAQKSTGPKSDSGKKRSSKNAYRHGLSVPISTVEFKAQLEELSCELAGGVANATICAQAAEAAEAELCWARVRRIQTAMIERALLQGTSETEPFNPGIKELRLVENDRPRPRGVRPSKREKLDASMPRPGVKCEERRSDDLGQILAALTRTYRYEKRAASRRDRAIWQVASAKVAK
jgi:hypothetical protein